MQNNLILLNCEHEKQNEGSDVDRAITAAGHYFATWSLESSNFWRNNMRKKNTKACLETFVKRLTQFEDVVALYN